MERREKDMLKHIISRLRRTRLNETICLNGWEVSILLAWIDEMRERREENEKGE